MAVLAATITVCQMRSSDSKLEKLHIEILEINCHPKIFVRERRERLAEEIEFFLELIDMNSKIEYYIEGNVQNPNSSGEFQKVIDILEDFRKVSKEPDYISLEPYLDKMSVGMIHELNFYTDLCIQELKGVPSTRNIPTDKQWEMLLSWRSRAITFLERLKRISSANQLTG